MQEARSYSAASSNLSLSASEYIVVGARPMGHTDTHAPHLMQVEAGLKSSASLLKNKTPDVPFLTGKSILIWFTQVLFIELFMFLEDLLLYLSI